MGVTRSANGKTAKSSSWLIDHQKNKVDMEQPLMGSNRTDQRSGEEDGCGGAVAPTMDKVLELLITKGCHMTAATLELEFGLKPRAGLYPNNEIVYIRDLISEGMWYHLLSYLDPMTQALPTNESNLLRYTVLSAQLVELLAMPTSLESGVTEDEVTACQAGSINKIARCVREAVSCAPVSTSATQVTENATTIAMSGGYDRITARSKCFTTICDIISPIVPSTIAVRKVNTVGHPGLSAVSKPNIVEVGVQTAALQTPSLQSTPIEVKTEIYPHQSVNNTERSSIVIKVETDLAQQSESLESLFTRLDRNSTGSVRWDSFMTALESRGLEYNQQERFELVKFFNVDGAGNIKFGQVLNMELSRRSPIDPISVQKPKRAEATSEGSNIKHINKDHTDSISVTNSDATHHSTRSRLSSTLQRHYDVHTGTERSNRNSVLETLKAQSPLPASKRRPKTRSEERALSPKPFESLPTFRNEYGLRDQQAIRAIDFAPSGKFLAVGSNSSILRVCIIPHGHTSKEYSDGTGSTDGQLSIAWQKKNFHAGSIYCVKWNRDGNLIATGSNDKTVKLQQFDSASCDGDSCTELRPRCGTVRDVAFCSSSGGSQVLACGGGGDNAIVLYDCNTSAKLGRLAGHSGQISGLATSDSGQLLFSSGADKVVRLWDTRTMECQREFGNYECGATAVAASLYSDAGLVAAGLENGEILVHDIGSGKLQRVIRGHSAEVRSIDFNDGPGSNWILSGSYDSKVNVASLLGQSIEGFSTTVAHHHDKVISARWLPWQRQNTGLAFATSSADRTVRLWGAA